MHDPAIMIVYIRLPNSITIKPVVARVCSSIGDNVLCSGLTAGLEVSGDSVVLEWAYKGENRGRRRHSFGIRNRTSQPTGALTWGTANFKVGHIPEYGVEIILRNASREMST